MNEDVYAEWLVSRKAPVFMPLLKVLIIILLLFCVLMVLFTPVGLILGLLLVGAYYLTNLFSSVEYEYIFVVGELAIDRILGAQNRKRKMKLTLEDIELVAPWNSSELAGIKGKPGIKITDYSSKKDESKNYGIICRKEGETQLVIFEPGEKMLDAMRKVAPRKIIINK